MDRLLTKIFKIGNIYLGIILEKSFETPWEQNYYETLHI